MLRLSPKNRSIIVRSLLAIIGVFALASIGGCNTIRGAGEDVGALGEGVANLAENTKPY